jgi:hypothetical protein
VSDFRSSALRSFGLLGALVVVMSTFVAWYDFAVLFSVQQVVHQFVVPVDLWSLYPLAAALLCAGALACTWIVGVSSGRVAGAIASLLSLGVVVYAAVRILDIPGLAIDQLPPGLAHAVEAATNLEGGPFLALLGGIMLSLGALGVLFPARAGSEQRWAPSA